MWDVLVHLMASLVLWFCFKFVCEQYSLRTSKLDVWHEALELKCLIIS